MNKRNASKHFLLVLLVLLVALSLTSVASAQEGAASFESQQGILTRAQANKLAGQAVRLPDGRIQVIVTLSADPAVTAFINNGGRGNNASARSAAVNQQAAVRQEQAAFAAQAGSLGATVARSTSYVVNTVTVQVNPNQLVALSRLPGVKRVDADLVVVRDDTVSVPFMGADDAWTDGTGTGYTGAGTVIAVIDTGIDYIHTDFGGSGDYDDNPDSTNPGDSPYFPAQFPLVAPGAPKVIGGTDYVGDDYDATGDNGSVTPSPDGDPIDCAIENGGGHGTHVAGSAAGWGVNADGTTYAGPFDNTIFTGYPGWTDAFRIGPGVAPEAALVALRVFGCNGSTATSIFLAGIDDAVSGATANGVQADVINMSLGSAYGHQDPDSPENIAIKNATEAGTAVVMSAGNNGDFFFITGSPGQANEGIAVASAVDPGNQARGVQLNDLSVPEETVFAAAYAASSPFIHDPVTAVYERPEPNPNGCTPADFATFTEGNIALIDRGDCDFSVKQDNAFAAGASGVVVANIASSAPGLVTMAAAGNPNYNLPTVHVDFDSGEALRAAADGTNTITLDWTLAAFMTETADTLSSFSSRGPSRGSQGSFKPDLAAPGNSILSAGSGTGEFTYNISGTSMASPHIAGAMALLREKYPTWSVADLKALIMNTSTNPVSLGANAYGPQRVGSGRADLADTFAAGEVIAYNTENPAGVSVNFGAIEVVAGETLSASKTITLKNLTETDVEYDVTFTQGTNMVGVAFSVTESTVVVPANGTATVTVNLTGDPNVAGVNTNSDPTLSTANSRHYLTEESGYVVFTPSEGSTEPLQVGVYAAPRVNSSMTATDSIEVTTASGTDSIELSGTGVATGAPPTNIVSLVSAFELVATSPNEEGTPDNADLAYVGIYSDYPAAAAGAGRVYFAFATHGDWNSPNEVGLQVMLDYNSDGIADFAIFNDSATGLFDTYTVEFTDINGLFGPAGAIYSYSTVLNGFVANSINSYALNNNVIFLPLPMEDLLDGLSTEFSYWIETYSARYEDSDTEELLLVDSLGSAEEPFTYNPEAPAFQFPGGLSAGVPVFQDADGGSITVNYDFSAIVPNPVPSILLLHHHNDAATGRAEVVEISVPVPGEFALVSPEDGLTLETVEEIEALTTFTWTEAADAVSYLFEIERDADTVVSLDGLTPADGDDDLTCADGTCTLTLADPLSVIDENGEYVWSVYAFSDLGMTSASNNSFVFGVDVPSAGDFTLISPVNNSFFTDPAALTAITWSESENAAAYNFLLLKLSGNANTSALGGRLDTGEVLKLDGLTPAADTDALTCADGTCTLTVDATTQAELTDGTYAWTVFADNGFDTTEASNAAYLFKVNTGDIELLVNGSFEAAGAKENAPADWTVKNKSGDKRKVDAEVANSGIAYFSFKGKPGENAKLTQKVSDNSAFGSVALSEGDTLTAQVFINTEVANPGKLIVKIKYADPTAGANGKGKDKLVVNLTGTTGYQAFGDTITIDDTVTKLVFIVGYTSTSGKMSVDDASLVRSGLTNTTRSDGGSVLPLPPSGLTGSK